MIYLDNAATTQIDDRVLEEMMPYLTESYGNAEGKYEIGRRSATAVRKAREQVADLIHADPEHIIFTSGGSEANNLVFGGMRHILSQSGLNYIITTEIEHDSTLNAVKQLQCSYDFRILYVKPNNDGMIEPESIERVIHSSARDNVGLVSVMYTNNETGVVNPIKEISDICNNHSVFFHTDCVQALGTEEINVGEIGCDFLSISSHKIHGPKGVGALYVRDKKLIEPLICGGEFQEFGLRGGTENVAGIVGFGKACELINEEHKGSVANDMRNLLLEEVKKDLNECGLSSILHENGCNGDHMSKILNLRFDGIDSETLLMLLDKEGVCASAGSACSSNSQKPSHVLTAMGLSDEEADTSIRFSTSWKNTEEEMIEAARIIARSVMVLSQC